MTIAITTLLRVCVGLKEIKWEDIPIGSMHDIYLPKKVNAGIRTIHETYEIQSLAKKNIQIMLLLQFLKH